MKFTDSSIQKFRKFIFTWWKTNKRDLPWRHTHDPYRILVSEIMLQQTQVSRVVPKYSEFISQFPNTELLSQASVAQVLRAWKGMGYNRRAIYLHGAARCITGQYRGAFPEDEQSLLSLPGVGRYTARAVLVFAFGKQVAMVDTNIRQIITHFFYNGTQQSAGVIQSAADTLVPFGKSWEWHQALMDYGALGLTKPLTGNSKNIRSKAIKKIPFKESNRFIRGKIIDILREQDCDEIKLVADLVRTYDRPEAIVRRQLDNLMKEKLITVKSAGLFGLPD